MSKSNFLDVLLLQAELIWENAAANRQQFERAFEGYKGNADLIVLPEMFNSGFTMNASDVAETMQGETVKWLCQKSQELSTAICGSIIIEEDGKYYNRFLWAQDGEITTHYDKRHLFRMAKEHHTFSPGNKQPEINFKDWKIMPRVCYDLRFPVWSRSNEFDLQIYVANWPAARVAAWDKLLKARAIENQCYIIGLNRIGSDGSKVDYCGHSIVIDPKGNAMTPESNEDAGWISARLDMEELNAFREKFPVHLDADKFSLE
jgi:predicted amidohydrolase